MGVALGLALCVALRRTLSTFLYAVEPFDPSTVVTVSLLVLGTGAIAAYLPARRAARLDPLTIIRSE
jgi:ABC-type antimicrobial peptide transport system permease subunit